MRFHIDGWDPAYGSAMEDTGEVTAVAESTARIDAAVETPPEQWSAGGSPVRTRPSRARSCSSTGSGA